MSEDFISLLVVHLSLYFFLVFHHTDTHIMVFYLTLVLFLHNKNKGPLLLLRDIHSKLLADYGCKEVCAPSQSQAHAGTSGVFWWTQLPGQ